MLSMTYVYKKLTWLLMEQNRFVQQIYIERRKPRLDTGVQGAEGGRGEHRTGTTGLYIGTVRCRL